MNGIDLRGNVVIVQFRSNRFTHMILVQINRPDPHHVVINIVDLEIAEYLFQTI